MTNLNTELQDVQRIMVQNIDDVLQRGAVLSELENKSQNLTEMSRKYRKDAESLNATSLAVIAGQFKSKNKRVVRDQVKILGSIIEGLCVNVAVFMVNNTPIHQSLLGWDLVFLFFGFGSTLSFPIIELP